jgi:hypothetical protein
VCYTFIRVKKGAQFMENLRKELHQYKGQRATFIGEFSRVSVTKIRKDIVVLLYNVKDSLDNMVAEHMWSTVDLSSVDERLARIKPGQPVKFEGRVHTYVRHDGQKSTGIDDIIFT